jgi:4-amino-4-deoxy-L-arabinose transferase-like glycosyltransferase
MKKNKLIKHILENKIEYLIILIISVVYLIKLTSFPIFADEAIYLNWADRIFNGFEGPFISLNDGKPPLFIWIIGIYSRIIGNLFYSGRFASVDIFIAFLIFINIVLKKHHQKNLNIFSIILLSLSPYIFFHTRMSLMDSTLSVFIVSALLVWLSPKMKYRHLISGLLFGLAYWTKTPAMFLIPFPLISTILFDRRKENFIKSFISIFISVFTIYGMKVSVFFHKLFSRSQDFTFSVEQILGGEVAHIFANLRDLTRWIITYNYYPYLIIFIIAIYLAFKKDNLLIKNLVLAFFAFISPFIFLGRVVHPRYYLPAIFIFSIVSAFTLSNIKSKKHQLIILLIVIIYPLFQNLSLLNNYNNFNFPKLDEFQYLKDWSSGIGIKESMEFFSQESLGGKLKILSEGFFGTTPDGLFVYYADLPF